MTTRHLSLAALAALLAACAPMAKTASTQDGLPDPIRVPPGHVVALETQGVGQITYQCRSKSDHSGHDWVFVGPEARLLDRAGKAIGRYYGPPATWEGQDGSKVTGPQLAVAPAGAGHIPLQLVKANPATGMGAMQGVSFIQRVATRGGVAPADPCNAGAVGRTQIVPYQADYIFWKPA